MLLIAAIVAAACGGPSATPSPQPTAVPAASASEAPEGSETPESSGATSTGEAPEGSETPESSGATSTGEAPEEERDPRLGNPLDGKGWTSGARKKPSRCQAADGEAAALHPGRKRRERAGTRPRAGVDVRAGGARESLGPAGAVVVDHSSAEQSEWGE